MNPCDQGPTRLFTLGGNCGCQLSLAASSHPRQHCARLGVSEDGIEELVLPFSLDEACSDPGAAAEANPRGRGRLVSSDRAMDLLDIRSHCRQTFVSLCLPVQDLFLPRK